MPKQSIDRLIAIGRVRSELSELSKCPKMENEDAPQAVIEVKAEFGAALKGIEPGAALFILTWLHQADRQTLWVHPRGNPENPLTGVFNTRSPDRPNPIGLHLVTALNIEGVTLHVSAIEVIDKTPVIDIKTAFNPR